MKDEGRLKKNRRWEVEMIRREEAGRL